MFAEVDGSQRSGQTIFYIADWLPPDFGAVGQYTVQFAREFAARGDRVCVIGLTSASARTDIESFPSSGTLEIRRIAAKSANKSRNIRRLLWAIQTNLRLIAAFLSDPRARGSELLITGSPPFMLFFGVPAKWLRRAALRYRITDFYPEVVIADSGKASFPLALLARVTWWLRRRVDMFEVLGEDQRKILLAGGIALNRIVLKRDTSPVEITGDEKPSPKPREIENRFVLLYSGNYGVAHEVDTVLEGYLRHHREGSGRFALWLNATGANADLIEIRLKAADLVYARTSPGPLSELPRIMAAADAHLITLRNEFAGFVLPSKIYAGLASHRPILFVGPMASDVHLLCCQSKDTLYEHVQCGDGAGFAAALERLADAISMRSFERSPADQARRSTTPQID